MVQKFCGRQLPRDATMFEILALGIIKPANDRANGPIRCNDIWYISKYAAILRLELISDNVSLDFTLASMPAEWRSYPRTLATKQFVALRTIEPCVHLGRLFMQ